jgi:hypothetical protein
LPTNHILQLKIENSASNRELIVRVHTREFDKHNFKFRPRRNENDETVDENRIKLPTWTRPAAVTTIVESGPASAVGAELTAEPPMPSPTETAQRELLVYFFRLGTPDRYAAANEAKLLRDGDDSLTPQTMWAEVFRRATDEPNGLFNFWAAVASRTPTLKDMRNPFEESHAPTSD